MFSYLQQWRACELLHVLNGCHAQNSCRYLAPAQDNNLIKLIYTVFHMQRHVILSRDQRGVGAVVQLLPNHLLVGVFCCLSTLLCLFSPYLALSLHKWQDEVNKRNDDCLDQWREVVWKARVKCKACEGVKRDT
jgi:hypothetical protein